MYARIHTNKQTEGESEALGGAFVWGICLENQIRGDNTPFVDPYQV